MKPARFVGSEDDFRSWWPIFERLSWGVLAADAHEDSVLMANAAMAALYGYAPEALRGLPLSALFTDGGDAAGATPWTDRLFAEGHVTFEATHRHRDGAALPVMVHVSLLMGPDGAPRYQVAHVQDMREHYARLEAQRNQAIFLDAVIENIPDMIFVKDAADLRFVRLNRAAEALLGHSRDDLLGRNDYDFFPPDEADFFTAKDREVLAGTDILDIPEEPIHTEHRGVRILHTKKVPIRGDDGEPLYLLGISEDVTARKTAEAELQRRATELQRSNEELEHFAYIASHDLKEPLRVVAGFVELLEQRQATWGDAVAREFIQHAVEGVRRMDAMINSLLDYARLATQAVEATEVSLDEVVDDALQAIDRRREESGATVRREPLPTVKGDALQLTRVFQNLLDNAMKFHGDGPPTITVSARRTGTCWEIRVVDDGMGMSPEDQENAFEMYRRGRGRARAEGAGMGLAICRRIIEAHGGTIRADGGPGGQGTAITVTLPVP